MSDETRVFRRDPDGSIRELGPDEAVDLTVPHFWMPPSSDMAAFVAAPLSAADGWEPLGYTVDEFPPVDAGSTVARAGELVDTIDARLAAWAIEKPRALSLVADNEWCVRSLGRRNITVPGAEA